MNCSKRKAACTPEAIAVVHEGARLTYAELNARANRLAHHLRTLGVKPDVLVAIGVERSLELNPNSPDVSIWPATCNEATNDPLSRYEL